MKNYKKEAHELVSKMTIEEKCSQLRYDSPAVTRLGIPSYNWWNEALHGVARAGTATVFPQAIAMAATFDDELVYSIADVISTEARAKYNYANAQGDNDIYKGLTMWSPNINIFRDPRWGRGHETYGEDPYLTSKLGVAFVKGLQGEGEYLKTAACAKHFAVHSGPEALRHEFNAEVSEKDLRETYLFAFEKLVGADVAGVMGAYNCVNGEPACANSHLMDILYHEWSFDGYFVSDCWAIRDFHTSHMVTATAEESAALAITSGCDINCGNTYIHAMKAVQNGLLDEKYITRSAEKAMEIRLKLGMGKETEFDRIPFDVIDSDEHNAVSLQAAEKSMVLLKNNGILPLDKNKIKSIAVIGPNADSRAALYGNYCGTSSCCTTFLQGIKAEFNGRVYYSEGCHLYQDKIENLALPHDRISEAVAAAEHADVVILCLGLDATLEGEEGDTGNSYASGDKPDLCLPKSQQILLDAVLKTQKPLITVLAAGSSVNIGTDKTDALIDAWYPGSHGGKALADILFGKVSPSGKLPVTFYRSAEALPDFNNYSMSGRTYRYAQDNILYPFGYGLTYSSCVLENFTYKDGIAECSVANIGAVDTDQVIQIYVKINGSEFAPINHSLCGFKRVSLKAGERKVVDIPIERQLFMIVDEQGKRRCDGTGITLYAGFSQPDELSCSLTGQNCLSVDISL